MKLHANARTTPKTGAILAGLVIRLRRPKAVAARALQVSPPTAAKWIRRYRAFRTGSTCDGSGRLRPNAKFQPAAVIVS